MKYALVTGGSRGLGQAICLKLAQMGIPVVINYRSNEDAAMETLQQVVALGGQAELCKFDVADSEETSRCLEAWEAAHPDDYVAYLVNNAGIRKDNMLYMMPYQDWNEVIRTTLDGFYNVTSKLIAKMMMRRHGGRIVNVASLSGLKGLPGQTNYSAAKAALIGATKALALEVAPRQVVVNAIAPGFIETDMTKDLDEEELRKIIPMNRFGKPEEVAALVGFLLSDEAGYITGQVIGINGGLYT